MVCLTLQEQSDTGLPDEALEQAGPDVLDICVSFIGDDDGDAHAPAIPEDEFGDI